MESVVHSPGHDARDNHVGGLPLRKVPILWLALALILLMVGTVPAADKTLPPIKVYKDPG